MKKNIMQDITKTKQDKQTDNSMQTDVDGQLIVKQGGSRRLNILNEISLLIDNSKSREEILKIVRSEVKRLFDYQVCMIGLLNKTRTHYVVHTLSSVADSADLNHKHFSIDEGMLGWVMKNQTPIVEEIESGPVFSHALEGKIKEFGIKFLLIVPMKTGSEVVGSLTFGSTKSGIYTEQDAAIAQLLGFYISVALQNTTMLEDTQKRITQIELINEVSSQLTSNLDLEMVLNVAATTIQKDFNYFDVTIFLLSEDKKELVLEAHAGSFVDFLPHGYRQKSDQGLIGWVAMNGEKILCNDVFQDPRYIAYEYHNTKSELSLPIRIENEVVGVLNIEDTKLHAFDETDAIVLQTLCDQLSTAIKNARLYDEIRKANMKLTELDKMKSEFLGIVSHDFRSPLSSIILAGKSLLKNEAVQGIQRVKEYLQLIVDQANRLNQLAEDTLSIAKVESGQLSYYFKIVNIERLLQDAISLVKLSSRHQVEYTIDPNVVFIKGDQSKLRQVVGNLVNNAVKYSPRGGKVKIVVEDHSAEAILVSVIDEGIGIPQDKMDKLFQKFSRIDSDMVKGIKGTGLGLWICKEIVQAHGGSIWVESELNKGSVFKFTLKKAQ
jgi:K+-sensing histidine kinase KdpD